MTHEETQAALAAAGIPPLPSEEEMMRDWGFTIEEEFMEPGDPRSIGTIDDARRIFWQIAGPTLLRQVADMKKEQMGAE